MEIRVVDVRNIELASYQFQTATRRNSCTVINLLAWLPNLLARAKGYVTVVFKGEKVRVLLNENQKKLLFPRCHFGNKDRRLYAERILISLIQSSI